MTTGPRTRIGVLGANGRMGQSVRAVVEQGYRDRIELSRIDLNDNENDWLSFAAIIDFSSPEAVSKFAARLLNFPRTTPLPALIIGSTGLGSSEQKMLDELSRRAALLQAANFSLGVELMQMMLRASAPHLRRLGYSVTLSETHHVHKKDRPSGTALAFMKTLEQAGFSHPPCQSIREGEVIGTHEIRFSGSSDEIFLRHTASDRALFARGAVEVALWIAQMRMKNSSFIGRLTLTDYFRALDEMG